MVSLSNLPVRTTQPAGALGMAGEQLREPLSEGSVAAGWVAAVEAPNLELQPDGLATDRQIGTPALIPTMDQRADRTARWAAGVVVRRFGNGDERGRTLPRDTDVAAARQREKADHALIRETEPTKPNLNVTLTDTPNSAMNHRIGPITCTYKPCQKLPRRPSQLSYSKRKDVLHRVLRRR